MMRFLITQVVFIIAFYGFVISKPAIISGNIKNPQSEFMIAVYYKSFPDFVVSKNTYDTVKIKRDGSFILELDIKHPVEFHLHNSGNWIMNNAYIEPGSNLELLVSFEKGFREIDFGGTAAVFNHFLFEFTEFFYKNIEVYNEYHNAFALPLEEFLKYIDDRRKSQQKYFADYFSDKEAPSEDFKQYIRAEIDWKWATDRTQYLFKQRFFKDTKKLTLPSPNYFDFLKELDINNPKPYSNLRYPYFIHQYIYLLNQLKAEEMLEANRLPDPNAFFRDYLNIAGELIKGEAFDIAISLQMVEIINQALSNLPETAEDLRRYSRQDKSYIENYLAMFKERSTEKEYYYSLMKLFDENLLLAPGQPAPDITLNDINGKKTSLSDFRGNLVYVDFWATWCAPCMKEMDFAVDLQKKYSDSGVVFLYVSFDNDLKKVKDVVKKKKIGGVHLWAKAGINADFAKTYKIKTIPRYLLIDRDGRLITADAPPPSANAGAILQKFLELDNLQKRQSETDIPKPDDNKTE